MSANAGFRETVASGSSNNAAPLADSAAALDGDGDDDDDDGEGGGAQESESNVVATV